MIYVEVKGIKSEGRGNAGGNLWFDTDDVGEAIAQALEVFDATWSAFGHGACETYQITVATEASPRRTVGLPGRAGRPLPVKDAAK